MFDPDTINTINKENRKEQIEIEQKKKHILKFVNHEKKQEEWNKVFPKQPSELKDIVF